MDKIYFFTQEQGILLVRLLLAHIIADFALQSTGMVKGKTWFSKFMGLHILIVFLITWGLSFSWKIALVIAFTHWLIDSVKETIKEKNKFKDHALFVINQLLHVLVILALWAYKFRILGVCGKAALLPLSNYKLSLYLLAYATVVWPLGYLIKFALHKLMPPDNTAEVEHGGRLIGQFERIIILTFVLLGQYEAIGFLITGKSIIRFAQRNENLKSEYVLVGTMMSYSLSILIGIITKWLVNM